MKRGSIVASRFVIEELAGRGSMGEVYAARDEAGRKVALKLLRAEAARHLVRFEREARVLAGLDHHGIVRCLDFGVAPEGAYLALEWLEGETLLTRLDRAALDPRDAMRIALQVAEALGAAHDVGIVHRDVKPANVFLVGGDPTEVKLLDFGIARVEDGHGSTEVGTVLGTFGYMSPEQAQGLTTVDARADVFSLGCVLFHCLAGEPPYRGADPIGILASILFKDPPRITRVRPDITPEVERLVLHFMDKDMEARPADGAAAAVVLAPLLSRPLEEVAAPSRAFTGITAREVRLSAVVVSLPRSRRMTPKDLADRARSVEKARAGAAAFEARVEMLAGGPVVAQIGGGGTATDWARRAVHCAQWLQTRLTADDVAVATVRSGDPEEAEAGLGLALERAAALVRRRRFPTEAPSIVIDDVTAGLVGNAFVVDRDGRVGPMGEDEPAPTRAVPPPFLGRDRELASLVNLFREVRSTSEPQVVFVVGVPGIGKSHLLRALQSYLRMEGAPLTWSAHADPVRQRAPWSLVGSLLEHALELGESGAGGRATRLRRAIDGAKVADPERVLQFVAELCCVPLAAEEALLVRTAKVDPAVMFDQTRRALADLMESATRRAPLAILVDDAQWADGPSAKLLLAVLRELPNAPVFLVVAGRAEGIDVFERWAGGARVTTVRLDELDRAASYELARHLLRGAAGERDIDQIVDRASGNPFLLGELARVARAGNRSTAVPLGVLAMVEARLQALPPMQRRVLRALAVFGQPASAAATAALLGRDATPDAVAHTLDELSDDAGILDSTEERDAPRRYQFRHAVEWEATYGMLTEGDRRRGHRLAAEWLKEAGGASAAVLARHLDQAGAAEDAEEYLEEAAHQALRSGDLRAALDWAERASPATLGEEARLLVARGKSHAWLGEQSPALVCFLEAMQHFEIGSDDWLEAQGESAQAAGRVGDVDRLMALSMALVARPPGRTGPETIACARSAAQLLVAGEYALAECLLDWLGPPEALSDTAPMAKGAAHVAWAWKEYHVHANPEGMYLGVSAAAECFERAGDALSALRARSEGAYALAADLGKFDEGLDILRRVRDHARRRDLPVILGGAQLSFAGALVVRGDVDGARSAAEEALEIADAQEDQHMRAQAWAARALVHLGQGELRAAEHGLMAALEILVSATARPAIVGSLAAVRMAQGRFEEAAALAAEAAAGRDALGEIPHRTAEISLTLAEAKQALGDSSGFETALRAARTRLLARAVRIRDAGFQRSFLEAVPIHRRTLELAHRHLGPAPAAVG